MSDLKHVRTGDPLRIPAPAYNAFVDAARAHQQSGHTGATPRPGQLPDGVVLLKNTTPHDLGQYEVLGIEGSAVDPYHSEAAFRDTITLTGVDPSPAYAGNYAVAIEPIAAGAVGRARITGPTIARVYIADDSHGYAEIGHQPPEAFTEPEGGWTDETPSPYRLVSAGSGSTRILWRETYQPSPGVRWAVLLVGALERVFDAEILWPQGTTGFPIERYSWRKVVRDSAGVNGVVPVMPEVIGEANAREINGATNVPLGKIVRMQHVGQDEDGEHVYVFDASATDVHGHTGPHDGGYIPTFGPHDHRSNAHGGYAFAVYHPGTSLPQQPWAL